MKRHFSKFLTVLFAFVGIAVTSSAADQVTFTRHAYDEGGKLQTTFMAPENAPFCTVIEKESNVYEYTLLSYTLEPVYKFTVIAPENSYRSSLFFDEDDSFIQGKLITQHLFNDDDLYEVIFSKGDDEGYLIYNEKGEVLGECPTRELYIVDGDVCIYEAEEFIPGKEDYVSAFYTINKGGAAVNSMKAPAAKLGINPNPVKANESVAVNLPEALTADMTVKVFSINGSLMVQKECKAGDTVVTISASDLAVGVNPVVVIDGEGNVIGSGKIIRE